MNLSFIKQLTESSQYRTIYAFKTTNAKKVSCHLFLDVIAGWILFNEYQYAPIAIDYAKKTIRYGDFSTYRQNSTDMYLSAYALETRDQALFSDSQADAVFLERVDFNQKNLMLYLRSIANNNLKVGMYRQYCQRLERELRIDSGELKSLRRLSQKWIELTDEEKASFMDRLFKQYRMYARRSELYGLLKSFYSIESLDSEKKPGIYPSLTLPAAGIAGVAIGREIGKRLV